MTGVDQPRSNARALQGPVARPTPGLRRPPRTPPPWGAIAQQVAAVALVAAGLAYLAGNVARNLAASGMTADFGFLWQEAGFAMSFSLIPMDETASYGRVFVAGILNTLFIAGLALVTATSLGLAVGFARLSPLGPLRRAAGIYVETLRNLPLLLILIFVQSVALRSLPVVREAVSVGGVIHLSNRGIYLPWPAGDQPMLLAGLAAALGLFGLGAAWVLRPRTPALSPSDLAGTMGGLVLAAGAFVAAILMLDWERPALQGFDFRGGARLIPEFVALLTALTLYNAAFIAEIVRAGLQSVDRGQVEAARALGLRDGFIRRRIVLPQALRLMVPPLTNQYVHLIKASSLATVVGFPDLVAVFLGTSLNQTGRAIECIAMAMAVYLCLSLLTSAIMNWYNARVALVER